MSKHISKIKGGKPKGASLLKKGGGNQRKIGEATAKKMQEKAQQKRRPKDFDEEIDSDMADNEEEEYQDNKKRLTKSIQDDPFFQNGEAQVEDVNETIEEKRLKMTKKLLEELQQDAGKEKDDFFEALQVGGKKGAEAEVEIFNEDEDDLLTKRLKYQILEKKGKLFYNIADTFT